MTVVSISATFLFPFIFIFKKNSGFPWMCISTNTSQFNLFTTLILKKSTAAGWIHFLFYNMSLHGYVNKKATSGKLIDIPIEGSKPFESKLVPTG